jgi:succinate dehydrogenase/fumarate reductase flavoprotein subunit
VPKGIGIYKVVHDNVRARNITVRFSTPAVRLITSPENEVLGVWAGGKDGPKAIAARRGVVLACGGFESSAELQNQFWQAGVIPGVVRTHTGDGIRMAQDAGAGLWHMWHAHGTYGFHHTDPAFPFGIRVKRLPDWTPGGAEVAVPLSWILLNSRGQRFANEYPPYLQDTGHRPFDSFDPITQRFANIPAWLVFDEDGRGLYPVGHVIFNDPDVPSYTWSSDNLAEVENGILHRADTVAELAALLNVDVSILQATLDRWNASVDHGADPEFHRPPGTLTAVRRPPFYAAKVGPILSNTQGGPVHDPSQRILTSFGEPIPRLYAAGELGGLWGFLYQAGGNLAECFVGGRIAGRHAASLEPWSHHTLGQLGIKVTA